jgi:hypothetical protein
VPQAQYSDGRVSGGVRVQPVLLCGAEGALNGKTWALPQLTHALATLCSGVDDAPTDDGTAPAAATEGDAAPAPAPPPPVPVLVPVQSLAHMLHERPVDTPLDARTLLEFFVHEYGHAPSHVALLTQALEMRNLYTAPPIFQPSRLRPLQWRSLSLTHALAHGHPRACPSVPSTAGALSLTHTHTHTHTHLARVCVPTCLF